MKKWMIVGVLASCVSVFAGNVNGPDQETKEEFLQRVEKKMKKRGETYDQKAAEARFAAMDTNQDGMVTREERRTLLKKTSKEGADKETAKPEPSADQK